MVQDMEHLIISVDNVLKWMLDLCASFLVWVDLFRLLDLPIKNAEKLGSL